MEELLEQGVGILMLTSGYTEALEMSPRVSVLHRGRICKEFQSEKAIEADILCEAIGLVHKKPSKMLVKFCPSLKQDNIDVIKAK
jgi:ABC-type uncharacterized transport system ATPase subunit